MSYSIDGPLSRANVGGHLTRCLAQRKTEQRQLDKELDKVAEASPHFASWGTQHRINTLQERIEKLDRAISKAQK
jgi:hypothetical protein